MKSFKNDLFLLTCCSFLLLLTAAATPLIRIILGFPFVLFSPGYALTAVLYPGRDELTGLDRVALSLGLSIIIVPLIGVCLNYLWGIKTYPVLIALTLFNSILAYFAWCRRSKLPGDQHFEINLQIPWKWTQLAGLPRAFVVSLLCSLLFLLGTLSYIFLTPNSTKDFTEFYMVGQRGMVADYPHRLKVGEAGAVQVVIINREQERTTYSLEIQVADVSSETIGPISLDSLEKWENSIAFKAQQPGQVKVELGLFKAGQEEQKPYRKLRLWVQVLPAQD